MKIAIQFNDATTKWIMDNKGDKSPAAFVSHFLTQQTSSTKALNEKRIRQSKSSS